MRSKALVRICIVAVMLVAGCGLSKSTIYPGTASTPDLHEEGMLLLGEVETCRGAFCPSRDGEGGQEWPLALSSAPPASTYHTALRKRAVAQYHVPEDEVRLGEVTVKYYVELDGTIVGWTAKAQAGKAEQAVERGLSLR
jgi:hypothetical protein